MAKWQSSEEFDPFDVSFDDPIEEVKIDDLRIDDEEIDENLIEPLETSETPRSPLSIGQIIVSAFQVILVAVVALALVLAIGFGIVFGGQKLGVVPTRTSGSALSISILPTTVVQDATPLPQLAPTIVPALPTLTPDLGCTSAATWWNSQQVQDNYQYFSVQALNDARDAARLSALLEQMRIRRDFVANFPADPCLSEARNALLSSFDAAIETARAQGSGDQAVFKEQQAQRMQAFGALNAALWDVNVNTDSDSAPGQNVARDSGARCGAQAWYDSVKAHEQAFLDTAGQIDLTTMSMSAVQPLLDAMQAERANVDAVAIPVCAVKAQALLLGALDSYRQALDQQIAAKSATIDLGGYTTQEIAFLAWLDWLGVS